MKLIGLLLLATLSSAALAADKVAYISTKALLEQSPQAQQANKELVEAFGQREKALRELAISIQEQEKKFQTDSAIMSVEQKEKAQEDINRGRRQFQFDQQSLREDVAAKRQELLQQVQVTIREVIKDYGKKNGYRFIFTDNSIAYADETVDITQDILDQLQN